MNHSDDIRSSDNVSRVQNVTNRSVVLSTTKSTSPKKRTSKSTTSNSSGRRREPTTTSNRSQISNQQQREGQHHHHHHHHRHYRQQQHPQQHLQHHHQRQQQHHHHERHPSDEVIVLDVSQSDEYGNRTVPVYRRSVRLKFDVSRTNSNNRNDRSKGKNISSIVGGETSDHYTAAIPAADTVPVVVAGGIATDATPVVAAAASAAVTLIQEPVDASLDYHATVTPSFTQLQQPPLPAAAAAKRASKCHQWSALDDDVITTVMNTLQSAYPETLFVNPCITQCVLYAKPKHVSLFLDPLAAKQYANVFFVLNGGGGNGSHRNTTASVNNNNNNNNNSSSSNSSTSCSATVSSGGHHWSLLMYDRPSKRLFHYDSMRNANYRLAYEFGQKVCKYLNAWAVTDVRCEQQTSATDCGYYVVDNTLKLIYLLRNAKHTPPSQIARLPSLITKTKSYVVALYERVKQRSNAKTN